MKKIFLLAFIMIFTMPFANAANHELLDEEACKETKEGIGVFLWVAKNLFEENEKNKNTMQTEEERKANEKELLGGAIAFSQLAANYSTVYEVWCKN